MALPPEAKKELESVFGEDFSDSLLERLSHSADMGFVPELVWSGGIKIKIVPDAVVYPTSVEQLVELVKIARKYQIPIVPYGRGTNRYGNAIPTEGGITVDFAKMRRIEILQEEMTAVVEPGATWKEVDLEANSKGLALRTFPSSYDSTVGGGIAGDALGIGSYEWGFISDNLSYVKIVNPKGEIVKFVDRDLAKVAGAEGVTGLIVEAGIKLRQNANTLSFFMSADSFEELMSILTDIYNSAIPIWHVQIRGPAISHQANEMFKAGLRDKAWNIIFMYPATRDHIIRYRLEGVAKKYGKELQPLTWVGWWTFNHGAIALLRKTGVPIHQHGLIPLEKLPELVNELQKSLGPLGVIEEDNGFDLDIALERRKVLLVNAFTLSSLPIIDKKLIFDLAKNTLMMDAFVNVGGSLLSVGMFALKYSRNRLSVMSRTFADKGIDRYEEIRRYKEETDPDELFNPGKLLEPKKRGKIVFEIANRQRLALNFRFGIGIAKKVAPGGNVESYNVVYKYLESFIDHALTCISCAMCVTVCPQYKVITKTPYAPKGMFDFVKGALAYYYLNDHKIDIPSATIADISGCHKCGLCDNVCPENIPISYLLSMLSGKVAKTTKVELPIALNLSEREPFRDIYDPNSDYVLWVGSLLVNNVEYAKTVAKFLSKMGTGISFRIVDTNVSSGFYDFISGNKEAITEILDRVSETLSYASLVVTLTPEDYRALTDFFAQLSNIYGVRRTRRIEIIPIEKLIFNLNVYVDGKGEEINLHIPCFATSYAKDVIEFLTASGFKVKRVEGCSGAVLAKSIGKRAEELSKSMAKQYRSLVTLCPLSAAQFRKYGINAVTLVEFLAQKLGILEKESSKEAELQRILISSETKSKIKDIIIKNLLSTIDTNLTKLLDLIPFLSDSVEEGSKILGDLLNSMTDTLASSIISEVNSVVEQQYSGSDKLVLTSSIIDAINNVIHEEIDYSAVAKEIADKLVSNIEDKSIVNTPVLVQSITIALKNEMDAVFSSITNKLLKTI